MFSSLLVDVENTVFVVGVRIEEEVSNSKSS